MPPRFPRTVVASSTLASAAVLAVMIAGSYESGESKVNAARDVGSIHEVTEGGRYFPFDTGSSWRYAVDEAFSGLEALHYERTVHVTRREPAPDGERATFAHRASEEMESVYDLFLAKNATGVTTFGTDDAADVYTPLFAPYWEVRFDLPLGASFVQFERAGVPLEEDYDEDGRGDVGDFHSEISLVAVEPVSVPVGSFADALQVRRVTRFAIHFSGGGGDTMTEVERRWFAKDVGLVKVAWELRTESDGTVQSRGGESLVGYAVAGRSAGRLDTDPDDEDADLPSGMTFANDSGVDVRGPLVFWDSTDPG